MRRLSLKSTLFGVDPIFVGELLEKLPTKRQFWQFLGERAFRRKWLEYWLCAASHPRKPRGYWVWREMQKQKKPQVFELAAVKVAGWTRLELATSCVTGRVILHNYQFIMKLRWNIVGCSSSKYMLFYLSVNLANYLLIASKKSIFYFI